MLSQIDVLVCGNSDPGTSGLLSPFAKINGLYFDDSPEKDDFYYNLNEYLKKKYENTGEYFLSLEYDNPDDFYEGIMRLKKFSEENITMYGTSREGIYEVILNEEADMDDPTEPTTIALRKKNKDTGIVISSKEKDSSK